MLNISKIKSLRPKSKVYRVADGHGLCLEIKPSGVKAWRYRFRWLGKQTMMGLGVFPAVSLSDARRLRDDARRMLDQGQNPVEFKKRGAEKSVCLEVVNTFGDMYREWYAHNYDDWSYEYAKDLDERCQRHLLRQIGDIPINDITAMDVLAVFKKIEARGTLNMLKKVRGYASRVFRYSVGMGKCKIDPTRDLPIDIFKKERVKHYSTTTDPVEIAGILRLIAGYHGSYQVAQALKIAPYVFLRPGELTGLMWVDVDFDNAIVKIPAARMKMKRPHLVPLSTQVLALLHDCFEQRGRSEYVFESLRSFTRPINAETLRAALRRLGITGDELTTHGFRHMASTILNEQGWLGDAIERQLAHVEGNKVRGVYNQAEHLEVRKEMMQAWADYLDSLV